MFPEQAALHSFVRESHKEKKKTTKTATETKPPKGEAVCRTDEMVTLPHPELGTPVNKNG